LLLGKSNSELAHELSYSDKTGKGSMTTLMARPNARNRLQVVLAAQMLKAASDPCLTAAVQRLNSASSGDRCG